MLCLLATSVLPAAIFAAIFVKPLSEHKYTYKILSQIPLIFNLYSRKNVVRYQQFRSNHLFRRVDI